MCLGVSPHRNPTLKLHSKAPSAGQSGELQSGMSLYKTKALQTNVTVIQMFISVFCEGLVIYYFIKSDLSQENRLCLAEMPSRASLGISAFVLPSSLSATTLSHPIDAAF